MPITKSPLVKAVMKSCTEAYVTSAPPEYNTLEKESVVLTDNWQDLVLKLAALWYWLTNTAGVCTAHASWQQDLALTTVDAVIALLHRQHQHISFS